MQRKRRGLVERKFESEIVGMQNSISNDFSHENQDAQFDILTDLGLTKKHAARLIIQALPKEQK